MGLGKVLEERMIKRSELAARIGVNPGTITRWAKGEWRIPDHRVTQLAELLGVDEAEIRNGHGADGGGA